MTVYVQPGQDGAKVDFKARYENWIGGKWVPPTQGKYFANVTPITGKQFTEAASGTEEDIELALDAAHAAAPAWGKTSPADRAVVLNKIADRMMENLELLAVAETWDLSLIHISEPTRLGMISYAVFCLKKKKK